MPDGLFVDDYIGRVGPWSRYPRCYSSRIRLENDPGGVSVTVPSSFRLHSTLASAKNDLLTEIEQEADDGGV